MDNSLGLLCVGRGDSAWLDHRWSDQGGGSRWDAGTPWIFILPRKIAPT
jgi:hypothetical protein